MSQPHKMCPCCGFNFEADEPIERDGFVIDPSRAVVWDGAEITMSPGERGILYALAKADGHKVTSDALLNRISYRENSNIVAVLVCRIRKRLSRAGVPDPILSGSPSAPGYRWSTPALMDAA
jgi:DNA-binding response OmpR family regulator